MATHEPSRRKELLAEYRRARPTAGVYRILNGASGRALVGSAVNLVSVQNRFEFARTMKSAGALDGRLAPDVREFGFEAFSFDVLETFEPPPEMTAAALRGELAVLEELWREKLAPGGLY